MSEFLCRLYRGCRYSEKYGSHPGNLPLVVSIVLGGFMAGWLGAIVITVIFGSEIVSEGSAEECDDPICPSGGLP